MILGVAFLPFALLADFEVWFLRHGETDWNREKRLQGSISDTHLTELGIEMARKTADGISASGVRFDRIYTSPYARAAETAALVAAKTGPKPVADMRIREMCFGIYEGGKYGPGNWPDENLRFFFEMPEKYVPTGKGAESFAQVRARLRDFLESELKPLDGKVVRVLCVAHSLVLKALVLELADDNTPAAARNPIQPNCCVHVVHFSNGRFSLGRTGRVFWEHP